LAVPTKEREEFGNIISELAKVFGINQTRCHIFYHSDDPNLMGFNRDDQIFFGLEYYIQKRTRPFDPSIANAHFQYLDKNRPPGHAYTDWQALASSPFITVFTDFPAGTTSWRTRWRMCTPRTTMSIMNYCLPR